VTLESVSTRIAERVEVDPLVIAGLLAVVVQLLQTCYSDPADAAAYLRQDTPATRRLVRGVVRKECLQRGLDRMTSNAVASAVCDEAKTMTRGRMARMYAEVK
jgi:hypothetical protein